MIKLILVKKEVFVYDVDDWAILRKQYKIVGNIVGNSNFIPSLPLKLLPEEALLLLEKNLAEIYEKDKPVVGVECTSFKDSLFKAQQEEYRKLREIQLAELIDKIVEKRRKVGDERSKEEIFDEELNKSSTIKPENMIWPIQLHNLDYTLLSRVSKQTICDLTTTLKSAVFKDLWERGYYITSGEKFSGDFLVYLGDPIVYHAIFIVKCIESEREFIPTELIAFGRLGVSVKKRAVMATLKDGNVTYLTINWIDA